MSINNPSQGSYGCLKMLEFGSAHFKALKMLDLQEMKVLDFGQFTKYGLSIHPVDP